MTMGFKYQLVTCSHPRELVEVTLNHLETIRWEKSLLSFLLLLSKTARASIESSARTVELLDTAIAQIVKLCQEISNSEFAQIRQTLAKFFQDKVIFPLLTNAPSTTISAHQSFSFLARWDPKSRWNYCTSPSWPPGEWRYCGGTRHHKVRTPLQELCFPLC